MTAAAVTTEAAAPDIDLIGGEERDRDRRPWRLLLTPFLVVAALAGLWLYAKGTTIDTVSQRSLNAAEIRKQVVEHLELSLAATALVLLIAIPLGVALTRRGAGAITPVVLAIANIGQGAPAVGVIVLLAMIFKTGFWTAVAALVAYGVLPALRNTMVGLQQVDPALVEASRGIGMSGLATLLRVELPLAVPVILAGVRTTLVLTIGMAALATFIDGGGLGAMIVAGVTTQRDLVLVTGSVLVASLALLVDWVAGLAERYLRPRGV